MTAPDYLFGSAIELAASIAGRDISATEVVESHLERIAEVNPSLNAVVTLAADRALAEAKHADAKVRSGAPCGALHGVPFTVKDSFDTEGIRSTAATEGRREFIPARDATVVGRLRKAGAILLGKTNTPELTMGEDTSNPLFGRTNNPYNPEYSPSGSSGGAASIVAAGGSSLDIGSDTGGSIREPAHACGVVGLKPTQGRVPKTGHAIPFGIGLIDSITQVGPITRTVADAALALELMHGCDDVDFTVAPVALGKTDDIDPGRLRVGFFEHNGLWEAQPAVRQAVRNSVDALRPIVATIDETYPEPIARMGDLYTEFRTADGGWGLRNLLAEVGTHDASPALKRRIDAAKRQDTETLAGIVLAVDKFKAEMYHYMTAFDALVCPACPYEPWQHGAGLNSRYEEWSYATPFNLTGWPCLVLRAGSAENGMPVGVQIVAPPWREDIAITLGQIVEHETGGYRRPN